MKSIVEQVVVEKRASSELVGLGAVVLQHGKVVGLSVSGERKKGSGLAIAENDLWHIGSITKSFTATMIARLVEQGDLSWGTPIKDVFTNGGNIHPQWKDVTLENLLTHTSGAAANFPILLTLKNPDAGMDRMVAREVAVEKVLAKPPQATPASTFLYSNIGYTIAGVFAEKKMDMPWEKLISQEVFAPIGIYSGGFGAPQDKEELLSQPWGHKKMLGFTMPTKGDNTPIIGPAGTIHLSLNDLALYANEHLQGIQGRGTILQPESFRHLHKANLNNYAHGWVIGAPLELDIGNVHWHNGSNTMWYALLVLLPNINAAIAITSNDGNIPVAEKTSWDIVQRLIKPLSVAYKNK